MTTRRSMILMGAAALLAAPVVACAAEAPWTPLFNGKDLSGWRLYKGGAAGDGWAVEDGALTLKHAGGGNIVTEAEYGDFELEFDWKISKNGNSGVMYFVRELPQAAQPYHTGPEYQVLDNAGHADGKIPSHTAGAIYDLVTPSTDASKPVGEWNHARIVVKRGHIEHWLNGKKVAESSYGDAKWKALVAGSKFKAMPDFATEPMGRICLQDHGDPVWYRNIRIRKL
ncbi:MULTISPECIES: DUF1080 domain-containing protein [Asticcacaulis]|uniref:3-keto-disaccharide hydrolase n=1 Tax=Asticcacaulis TaxID=76890 RepID=UPI001AEA462E|nr:MULTISPECIES: DUF1080 domain-containing protein [Asticcacaulis]MBP2157954.1 hypothetical protein [Asticcacaulis solisilvae]MDR6798999.1 hypothetical protein [Asticcacaulis sp. BE141]